MRRLSRNKDHSNKALVHHFKSVHLWDEKDKTRYVFEYTITTLSPQLTELHMPGMFCRFLVRIKPTL